LNWLNILIDNTEKSEQREPVEDLVQIITVFSCKLQGKPVKELTGGGGVGYDKNNPGDVTPK